MILELLTRLGAVTSAFIVGIFVVGLLSAEFTWRCGACGKTNTTRLLRFMLQWCDHRGDPL